jgi:hypothetical protein
VTYSPSPTRTERLVTRAQPAPSGIVAEQAAPGVAVHATDRSDADLRRALAVVQRVFDLDEFLAKVTASVENGRPRPPRNRRRRLYAAGFRADRTP